MGRERFKALVGVHLLLMRDDQVLLLLRNNTGYADGMYSVIAGHVDGDESVLDAVIREAHEEGNLSLTTADMSFGVFYITENI